MAETTTEIAPDEETDAPKKFDAERGIPWVQVSLGLGSETSITRDYGVQTIPATFLKVTVAV